MKPETLLIDIISSEIQVERAFSDLQAPLSNDLIFSLYSLSKAHDLAHIVAAALDKRKLLGDDEFSSKFRKQQMLAVYRYRQMDYELSEICRVLEDAKIPFIPLKGSVIRRYYPEPWMRTSCDIDVLVHEEDIDRAISALVAELEYKNEGRWYHDVSLVSQSKVHIELHFSLLDGGFGKAEEILADIWSCASPKEGCQYQLILSDGMYYMYHILHMAKHFTEGGCGIRPFVDLWILNNRVPFDEAERRRILNDGGLLPFADACEALLGVWFSDKEHDGLTLQMEKYVLQGGVYGSLENRASAKSIKHKSRLGYIISRIFPPTDSMKLRYPVLKRHIWLLPAMHIRRWLGALFGGRLGRGTSEIKVHAKGLEGKARVAELFEKLGLESEEIEKK